MIRAALLIFLFIFFKPAVFYLGIAAFVLLLYTTAFNIHYTKKYLSEVKIKKIYFDIKALIELISSGIWNAVIHLGQILLQGLNLLITNLFISATAMGMLAVANTVPMVLALLIGTVASVFMPDFTILYAKKNMEQLIITIKRSMKVLGLVTNVPIAILVAFGEEFFSLWVPTQDPKILQILSIIAVSGFVIDGSINSIYNIFTVTNKIKANALTLVFVGLLNVPIMLLLLKTTNFGVYSIVGVSSILSILRNLLFTAPYGAKCLGLKWNTFLPMMFKSFMAFVVVLVAGLVVNLLFVISDWRTLIIVSVLTAVLGVFVHLWVIFDKQERKSIFVLIKGIRKVVLIKGIRKGENR